MSVRKFLCCVETTEDRQEPENRPYFQCYLEPEEQPRRPLTPRDDMNAPIWILGTPNVTPKVEHKPLVGDGGSGPEGQGQDTEAKDTGVKEHKSNELVPERSRKETLV